MTARDGVRRLGLGVELMRWPGSGGWRLYVVLGPWLWVWYWGGE